MILFQDNYFESELPFWQETDAKIIHGLCREEDITNFEPIIPRGTIAFFNSVKFALRNKGWPDLTWPFNNDWKIYNYKYLDNCFALLNHDFLFFKGFDWVKSKIKHNGPMWVRSNSGSKIFSGGVFDLEGIMKEEQYFRQHGGTDIELVIASPKEIDKEWRLVIIEGEIVCSSMYMYRGEPNEKRGAPNDLLLFADGWIKRHKYLFPQSYTLDICLTNGEYKVVEVNNLLTSGWYACDIEKIVNTLKLWNTN